MIPNDGILAFETIRLKKLFRISSMERKTNDFKCGRQHRETPGNPSIRRRKLVCFGTTLFRAGTVGEVEAEMDWERTGWLMWRSGLGVPCWTCSFPLFYQQSNESKIKGFSLVCWWSSSYIYIYATLFYKSETWQNTQWFSRFNQKIIISTTLNIIINQKKLEVTSKRCKKHNSI